MNTYKMIDVGEKKITRRMAIAGGTIEVGPPAFVRIHDRSIPKGDPLTLCQLAGIQGAKAAAQTMMLCHPLPLDHVDIGVEPDPENHAIHVFCKVIANAKTGVEMEALAGVNAALLNIWDITKMIEPGLRLSNVRLLVKSGGKSGLWLNPGGVPDWVNEHITAAKEPVLKGRKAAVITLSDRAAAGVYEDKSGPVLCESLSEYGAEIVDKRIIADGVQTLTDAIKDLLSNEDLHLIICTGGTGVAERDLTPETLEGLFDRSIPGIGELLRSDGARFTPLSWSSRAVGGLIGKTLVVALPGSPRAVAEGISALLPALLPHLIRISHGEAQ
ncbi:bifunctional molybdenum cofactor biosynthesis protein MoaC/MoaB [Asticcacaulis sp. BYS171W]|uniref:Bifunctional molybdenum cofactor biosynthesis protein MoaC/MoaB n=1 Tax=Asticcacaulis aquaticus TaxID=2984212 RepID=A0ABT5HWH3_9CAUL|nr:bifunctional molybdenum cofactor biosynthesis protein MoaC/MoaB [Asticcacaulis aquaticus]MDC7684432.1 bifunctional molybdenum cofactor biosynthesis protein MoaC/MoaB [Asticcacaulis aquaticus]